MKKAIALSLALFLLLQLTGCAGMLLNMGAATGGDRFAGRFAESSYCVLEGSQKTYLSKIYCIYTIRPDSSLWLQTYGDVSIGLPGDVEKEEIRELYDELGISDSGIYSKKVLDDVRWVAGSYGGWGVYAIKTDGSLWAWGASSRGQLGLGETDTVYAPEKVMDDVRSVHLGYLNNVYAIKTDGSLWGWGGLGGYIGDGEDETRLSPVKIMDGVAQVVTGMMHTYAIRTDGSLWAWGQNKFGQLGDGTLEDRLSPVKIMENVAQVVTANPRGSSGVAGVKASGNTGLAIKTDGSLWTWGVNVGQLGVDGDEDALTPVKVMDDVRSVHQKVYMFGTLSVFAVKTDGSLWAWGQNKFTLPDSGMSGGAAPAKIMDNVAEFWEGTPPYDYVIDKGGAVWRSSPALDLAQELMEHQPFEAADMENFVYLSPDGIALRADGSLEALSGNFSLPAGSIHMPR